MKFSVYLAGKIAKEEDNLSSKDWRKEFIEIMDEKLKDFPEISEIVYLDPQTLERDKIPTEDFFCRDVYMIEMSDAVFVDSRIKVGPDTAQEILIAKYYNKPVVTAIPEGALPT